MFTLTTQHADKPEYTDTYMTRGDMFRAAMGKVSHDFDRGYLTALMDTGYMGPITFDGLTFVFEEG